MITDRGLAACTECGQKFGHVVGQPQRCAACRSRGSPTAPRTCRSCGQQFQLSREEVAWFSMQVAADGSGRPFSLPARCRTCRRSRRDVRS